MKNILLIQTGGTIAMQEQENQDPAASLDYEVWTHVLEHEIPQLHKIANIEVENLFFVDSSDINSSHWLTLAHTIQERSDRYDGFVILHGTDTMAYTASALSFAIRPLDRPVVLTGSQVPLSNIRSDARRNLINAVEMATHPINEVIICFNDKILRGNRATKMSIGDFDAFASPNFTPLAEIGLTIDYHRSTKGFTKKDDLKAGFDDCIFVLKIFPNMNDEWLSYLPLKHIKAVILEAFGTGNFPIQPPHSILPFLDRCVDNNVQLIITSQAPYDSVNLQQYDSGKEAQKRGALSAGDMTSEAAITKSMYLLSNVDTNEELRYWFKQPLAGELTDQDQD